MNPFQTIFDAQKTYFTSGVTRTYGWRIEQLDRMAGLLMRLRDTICARGLTRSRRVSLIRVVHGPGESLIWLSLAGRDVLRQVSMS
jgi:hypothetical protein